MRKITVILGTDSDESIEWIKQDIEQEVGCCSTYFESVQVYDGDLRPKGAWVDATTRKDLFHVCKCGKCGGAGKSQWDFCPWCGAKMKESDET